MLTSLALAKVERSLAKDAPAKTGPPKTVDRAIPVIVFALATVIFALGFQLHFFFNSAPRFKQFTSDVSTPMPVFWVGFSVAMFPASLITKRWGGLPVMGLFGIIGAIAIVVMEFSGTFEVVVAAQLIAGAAWGCILMSAFSAAAALGYTGAEGKTTGVLFSALALATFEAHDDDRKWRAQRPVVGAAAALGADCVLGGRGFDADGPIGCVDAA